MSAEHFLDKIDRHLFIRTRRAGLQTERNAMNEAWIETVSGEKFYLFYPERSRVVLGDVAHALSHTCRYNGHTSHFYSVAEHSIHVAAYLEESFSSEVALTGLMHDAAEAYVGDIVSPIKHAFSGFAAMEQTIQDEIIKQLCPNILAVYKEYAGLVSRVDKNIVNDERKALMSPTKHAWAFSGEQALNWPIPCWTSQDANQRFQNMFTRLNTLIKERPQKYFING